MMPPAGSEATALRIAALRAATVPAGVRAGRRRFRALERVIPTRRLYSRHAPSIDRPSYSEAQDVIAAAGPVDAAKCSAKDSRTSSPGAAPLHPYVTTGITHPGRSVRRRPLIAAVPAILDPLVDVAMELIEAPWVWCEACHRHGASPVFSGQAVAVGHVARIVGLLCGDRRTHQKGVVAPARVTYSRSASVGIR